MRFMVNGAAYDVDPPPAETLIATLRDRLQLTGTKLVCGRGECGACTVFVDDVAVYACLTLAASCEGAAVTTIEGIGLDDSLHPPRCNAMRILHARPNPRRDRAVAHHSTSQ